MTKASYWIIGKAMTGGRRPIVAVQIKSADGKPDGPLFTQDVDSIEAAHQQARDYATASGVTDLTHDQFRSDYYAEE